MHSEKYFLRERRVRQRKIRNPVVFIGLLDLERIFFSVNYLMSLGGSIKGVPTLTLVGGLRIAEKISWLRIFLILTCTTRGIDL